MNKPPSTETFLEPIPVKKAEKMLKKDLYTIQGMVDAGIFPSYYHARNAVKSEKIEHEMINKMTLCSKQSILNYCEKHRNSNLMTSINIKLTLAERDILEKIVDKVYAEDGEFTASHFFRNLIKDIGVRPHAYHPNIYKTIRV